MTRNIEITVSQPSECSIPMEGVRDALDAWREVIESAKNKLVIHQMYVSASQDSVSDDLVECLLKRAQEGLKIEITIDKTLYERNAEAGNVWYVRPVLALSANRNINIRLFDANKKFGGIHHAKIMYSDQNKLWLGSNNFDWRSFEHILELGLLISGTGVSDFSETLVSGIGEYHDHTSEVRLPHTLGPIAFTYKNTATFAEGTISPTNLSSSGTTASLDQFCRMIYQSVSTVRICTRRLSVVKRKGGDTDFRVIEAIKAAKQRGVSVRILVDVYQLERESDIELLKGLAGQENIEIKVVRYRDHSSGHIPYARMLHAKMMAIDSKNFWFSSANITPDDFLRSVNFYFMGNGKALSVDLESIFDKVWDSDFASPSLL